jgi:hypothetical protein
MEPKTINLHKALKIKNRLAGEYRRLLAIAVRENSRREDSPSKVDMDKLYGQINDTMYRLVDIKTRICIANTGIYRTIETMKEAKASMEHYRGLNTTEGEETEHIGLYAQKNGVEPKKFKIVAYMNQDGVDAKLEGLQKEINSLQDTIDDYNAKNTIEWDD